MRLTRRGLFGALSGLAASPVLASPRVLKELQPRDVMAEGVHVRIAASGEWCDLELRNDFGLRPGMWLRVDLSRFSAIGIVEGVVEDVDIDWSDRPFRRYADGTLFRPTRVTVRTRVRP